MTSKFELFMQSIFRDEKITSLQAKKNPHQRILQSSLEAVGEKDCQTMTRNNSVATEWNKRKCLY